VLLHIGGSDGDAACLFNSMSREVRYRGGCSGDDTRQQGTRRFADGRGFKASDVDFDHTGVVKHV
jgi:hypothetical protein